MSLRSLTFIRPIESPSPKAAPATAIAALTVFMLIGMAWLVVHIFAWRDRADVMDDGTTVNAEVLVFHPGVMGVSDRVTVRFRTAAGEQIVTDVSDPPTDPRPRPGGRLQIRYDPSYPHHAVPADGGYAVGEFVLYIVGGAALVGLSGYGNWWWIRQWRRKRRTSLAPAPGSVRRASPRQQPRPGRTRRTPRHPGRR